MVAKGLDGLPQFVPDRMPDPIDGVERDGEGEWSADEYFGAERGSSITRQLEVYPLPEPADRLVRGRIPSRERLLENTKRAIARFEKGQRQRSGTEFERLKARKALETAVGKIEECVTSLEAILDWKELSSYIDDLGFACTLNSREGQPVPVAARINSYADVSPAAAVRQLERTTTLLNIALKKVAYKGGDRKHDPVSAAFCRELVFAWLSGTGARATYTNASDIGTPPTLFNKFVRFVNDKLLLPEFRAEKEFDGYLRKAVKATKEQSPKQDANSRKPGGGL